MTTKIKLGILNFDHIMETKSKIGSNIVSHYEIESRRFFKNYVKIKIGDIWFNRRLVSWLFMFL